MSRNRVWGRVFLAGIFILGLHCTSLKKGLQVKEESTKEEPKSKGYINEEFDPLILEDDDLVILEKKRVETVTDVDEVSVFKKEPTSPDTVTTPVPELVWGYRVQICALSDEQAAREVLRDAILKFNEESYLIYDSPYYKVRVGDCLSRIEADRLQQLAIEKGFKDAWVVKTRVILRKR